MSLQKKETTLFFSNMYDSYAKFVAAHIMKTLQLYMKEEDYERFVKIILCWKQGIICGPVAEYMLLDMVSKLEYESIQNDLRQYFDYCPSL